MKDQKNGISIERRTQPKPRDMPSMHVHREHELFFLISGQRRYFIGHTIYDVFPGNLMIIPKNEFHRAISPGRNGYARYVVHFLEEDIPNFADSVGRSALDGLMRGSCLQLPADIVRRVQEDLEQLEQECGGQEPYAAAYASHLLQDVLLSALRYGKKRNPYSGETAGKIQEVARYISKNFQSQMTLHDAAQMAYMEYTYFSRCFKKLTGFGFQEYLTQIRFREAERLLLETELPVSEISERCGFSGSNYFGDAFRRRSGMSPSEFRQQKQKGSNRRA